MSVTGRGLLKGGRALIRMGPRYGIPVFILPRTAATSVIARESRARSSRYSARWASPSSSAAHSDQIAGDRRAQTNDTRCALHVPHLGHARGVLLTGEVLW